MENQQKNSDEIDLGHILNKIGGGFSSFGRGVVRFFAHLRNTPPQHKALFVSLICAGAVAGAFYSTLIRKKFYDSSMILSCDYFNKRMIDFSIDKLNLLADEESPHGLAIVLKIPDTLADKIVKFEGKPFVAETDLIELEVLKEQLKNAQLNNNNQDVIEQVVKRIEIENRHGFEFTVRTYNPTAIKPLQDALVNYFWENAYVKKRVQSNRDNLTAKKMKLIQDSQKLDSLKRVIYANYKSMADQTRQGSNNVIFSDKPVTNPIEIYNEDLKLYNQQLLIIQALYIQTDFEIVQGFTEFSEPTSASRTKIVIVATLIGLALGYIIVALKRFNQYLSTIN